MAILIVLTAAYVLWFTSLFTGLVGGRHAARLGVRCDRHLGHHLPLPQEGAHDLGIVALPELTILGVPLLTIAGVVYLGYIIALLYFAFIDPNTSDITGKKIDLFVVAWVAGMLWYHTWKYRSKSQGVDVAHLTYRELPPE